MVGERLNWIDIAKGVAIIAVIVSHTVSVGSPVRDFCFSFHMPLFFILAGYTFRLKPFREMLSSSIRRLLFPFALLFAITQIVRWAMLDDAFSLRALGSVLGTFLFSSGTDVPVLGFSAVGMSWFLVCLFMSRVLLWSVLSFSKKMKAEAAVQAACFFALLFLGVIIGGHFKIYLPFSLDIAFVSVWFMWVGYVAKEGNFFEGLGARPWVVLLGVVLWIVSLVFSELELAARVYNSPLLALIGAVAATYVVCKGSQVIDALSLPLLTDFLLFMGKNSMLVYCVHAVDWFIPWSSLAAFRATSFPRLLGAVARVTYDALLTLLMRRV